LADNSFNSCNFASEQSYVESQTNATDK